MKREIKGMLTGLGVTFKTMMKPTVTVQYPHEREDPPPAPAASSRSRKRTARSACCARASAPTGASTSRAQGAAPAAPRRRPPRSVSILDRFDIDYALCMYCGICVEVCPFDALFWSPEFEYAEYALIANSCTTRSAWKDGPTPFPSWRRRRSSREEGAK
jgi:NADH-quinone oxidoreductase subunit I